MDPPRILREMILKTVTDNLTVIICPYTKVEEVKRRQHCLMFSSAGSQAQTYFVNFDTLADYQRWHRQASKVSDSKLCVSSTQRVCVLSSAGLCSQL